MKNINLDQNNLRLAWRLDEAAKATGLSIQFLRKEIRQNHLEAKKCGRCVVILNDELKRYLKGGN